MVCTTGRFRSKQTPGSIHLCLHSLFPAPIFRTQIRALYRASAPVDVPWPHPEGAVDRRAGTIAEMEALLVQALSLRSEVEVEDLVLEVMRRRFPP